MVSNFIFVTILLNKYIYNNLLSTALTFGDVHDQTNELFKNEPQSTIYTPKKDQTDMLDGFERFLGDQFIAYLEELVEYPAEGEQQ